MIFFVVAAYYEKYLPHVLAEMRGIERASKRLGMQTECLFVLNNPALAPLLETPFILHDNSGMEFGAYQRGLDEISRKVGDEDLVIFANDTFCTHHCFSTVLRSNLLSAVQRMAATPGEPTAAGPIDTSFYSFCVRTIRISRWVSTWMFAMNAAALRAIDGLIYVPEVDTDIQQSECVDDFFSRDMDEALKRYLCDWLFRTEPVTTWHERWHGARTLTPESAGVLADKARSILQEKYLSARLEARSTAFYEIRPMGWKQRAAHCAARAFTGLQ